MTTSALGWLNVVLAGMATLAAFGSINKMERGKTKPCLMGAVILIAVGLVGQWAGNLKSEWAQYADTALYGGLLALLIASQRIHTWCLERWANPIASGVVLLAGAVLLLGLLSGCAAVPPPCERWQYGTGVTNNGKPVIWVDEENVERLRALIQGLAKGSCTLPPDGTAL